MIGLARASGIWLVGALAAASLAGGVARSQTPPLAPPLTGPIGMVEQPCLPGSFGRSEAEVALAEALVSGATPDPKVMAAYAASAPERAKLDAWREKNDFADLCRFRAEDERLMKQGGVRVVFLGDSITELWRAADPEFFNDRIVNRGISGQTSSQLLLRFEQDVIALRPKAVHIMIGTNDVAGNNGPERPEDLKNNLRAMVALAKAQHIGVILAAIPPASVISWRPAIHPAAQIRDLNAWIAGFAKAQGAGFVDYGLVLAGPDGGMKPALTRDGVHPVKAGYELMRPIAQAAMAR
ncbi:MAG TPA: GDSL-type esterase/lipase family protein [Phenylobacterium sp.]|jgi:lysophospholipase L1-like esterase|nr:GDSL-type esterase/lipase family protein [Phenylobacterium sp.]